MAAEVETDVAVEMANSYQNTAVAGLIKCRHILNSKIGSINHFHYNHITVLH